MPVVDPERLVRLQHESGFVRNICVLAHVDHGKTSLTDSLIATNGIISAKMAGKVRYLDSRPDEQTRGITMESSAISLLFSLLRREGPDETPTQRDYLINLIDSPGHVDFSSEVSTASRLCDGAIILVDAVEGVCSQTVAVLRQAWLEQLKPILVINKMDRLVTELKMSPLEAYSHLTKLIEQVNAVLGSFYQGERMEDDLRWRERLERRVNGGSGDHISESKTDVELSEAKVDDTRDVQDVDTAFEEKGDEDLYFEPDKGNVVFSSAVDGWAFTTKQFAALYEKKLGIKRDILEKVLWGDFYLDPRTKRILGSKHLKGRALKPMFVQLVLENIWAVYEAATGGDKGKGDANMVEKIAKSLSLNLPAYILRSRDPRAVLTALFNAWVPLSTAVLVSVIERLPSPTQAQAARTGKLLDNVPGSDRVDPKIRHAMQSLNSSRSEPLVVFVSKMVAVPVNELPENKTRAGQNLTADEARELGRKKRAEIARAKAATNGERTDVAELREALSEAALGDDRENTVDTLESTPENAERLIGFARIFSGTLEVGDEVYVLHPKFTPADPHRSPEPQKVTITALYLLMGRGLEPLNSVPAGVVFGIGGLEGHIQKSGTLCSQLEGGVNLAGLSMGSQPIVRVALEPENPADLDKMVSGLKLLEQSDPCASYEILENGEHVILTAGEVHLERCLKDLQERFARCQIQVGAPIVPYRESIVTPSDTNSTRDKDLPRGTVVRTLTSRRISIRLRVQPLPIAVTEFLLRESESIRELYSEHADEEVDEDNEDHVRNVDAAPNGSGLVRSERTQPILERITNGLKDAFVAEKREKDTWQELSDRIVSFGPRRIGPNLLIDATADKACKQISMDTLVDETQDPNHVDGASHERLLTARGISNKISYAFQLATGQGPLCQEPMQGVAVILEDITIPPERSEDQNSAELAGRLSGELIRTMRESIRQGFLAWSPRIMLAMYSCEIQSSTEVLGRVYGVITRRRGRILSESMNEGTPFFTIVALLPVVESFGFSEEIRKRTSGAASPQLVFQGYEMLDEDPFWVPFTEEELEDLGELADKENLAKKYVDGVRKRKGLYIEKKLVANAEKQKTLKR